jgi:pimeloyl-ACP methyl ester carboxylesterase
VSALILQHRDGRETAHEPGGLAEVFPAFVPTDDGGHLVAAWHMVRRTYLYDPWFATTAAARRIGDVPAAAVLHQQVMEVLRPTGDYAGLARAAAVAGMPRVDDGEELAARVFDAARMQPIPAAGPPPPQPASVPGALRRSYVRTPYGQLHLRSSGRGGTPLLVIHASPGSAAPLEPLIAEFGRHRHVIAPDTLGNGDSDRPARDDTDIGFYADVITAALDALDLPTVDVWGSHTGALIGLELAIRRPDRVRALGMDGITLFDPDEVRDLVAHYLPPLEPDDYGTHLLRAWHMRTDMSLFWPWYRRTAQAANRVALPAAEQLHTWVVDLLVSGPSWRTAYRAAFTYPTRERLPLLTRPALLAAGPHDPLAVYTDQAATLSAHLETATSAGTRDSDALRQTVALYEAFFSRRADRR